MDSLKDLDEVAYVRFAAVYRQFKDINTQFLVAMDPVVSEVLVTNSFGISTMYKLYRSYNILGGGIDVQIS